jgi:hypothetical protein
MAEQSAPGSPAPRLGLSLRRRGITARGGIALIYASNLTPGEIVPDVRVFADA